MDSKHGSLYEATVAINDPAMAALLRHPSIGVVMMSPEGQYQFVNDAAAQFFGESVEALHGRYHLDTLPDPRNEEFFAESASDQWQCYSLRRPTTSRSGGSQCWDISLTRLRTPSGSLSGYLMLIQEVSPLRQAMLDAKQQHKMFHTLLESVPSGVMLLQGAEGQITSMNQPAQRICAEILQVGAEMAHPSVCCRFMDEHRRPLLSPEQSPFIRALRFGENAEDVTLSFYSRSGQMQTLLVNCAPLGIVDGEPVAIAIIHNFSVHADYESRLEEKNRQLCELANAKDTFLANISHEFKTPLTVILGWVDIARASTDQSLIGQALEIIDRQSRRQAWMIENLLTLTNCQAGRTVVHPQSVNLLDCCTEAATRAHSFTNTVAQIVLDIPDGIMCSADPERLRQLLENVLVNAVKFSPSAGSVRVRGGEENGWVYLEVTDAGIGITSDELASLFQVFWQADTSLSRPFGGIGIGLALVKALVDLHGGEIAVRSDGKNQGTSISIRLPAQSRQICVTGDR